MTLMRCWNGAQKGWQTESDSPAAAGRGNSTVCYLCGKVMENQDRELIIDDSHRAAWGVITEDADEDVYCHFECVVDPENLRSDQFNRWVVISVVDQNRRLDDLLAAVGRIEKAVSEKRGGETEEDGELSYLDFTNAV